MSKDTLEVGDVWINKTTGDRVQVKLSLTTIIMDTVIMCCLILRKAGILKIGNLKKLLNI